MNTQWLQHDRFGMFIHFGLYSLAARHEWVKSREKLDDAHYQRYFDHFNPDVCGPKDWARIARESGMKYVVLTTKHHEGFCLWDSALTDYKVTNTPFGKDLLREYVDALAAEGLKVGFYHSIIDWHHPDYMLDVNHPQRDEDPEQFHQGRDWQRYVDYLHGQVRELLTDYGKVDYLWFDFSMPDDPIFPKGHQQWQSEQLMTMARELQPGIVINDRLDLPGDTTTPEQVQPIGEVHLRGAQMWEACQTINGSWGYDRDNTQAKSPDLMVRMLIDGVSKGGNLLLNVGPDGRGCINEDDLASLHQIGRWMRLHERSIVGCGPETEFIAPTDVRYTRNGNKLYAHILAWPMNLLHLPGLGGRISYAQLLNDGSEVKVRELDTWHSRHMDVDPTMASIELPARKPNVLVPVIELTLID